MQIDNNKDITEQPYFKKFRSIIEKALNDQVDDFVNQSGFFPYWRLQKAYGSKDTTADIASDVEKSTEAITLFIGVDEVYNVLVVPAEAGGKSYLDKVGIKGTFKLANNDLLKRIKERQDFLIGSVNPISGRVMGRGLLDTTTIEWISGVLTRGLIGGKSNKDIGKDLLEHKKIINKNRAEMIANAEISNSIMSMERETALRNGSQEKLWDTANDLRVTGECRKNERFGWHNINEPCPSGHLAPPRFPRCRCVMQYSKPPSTDAFWLGE